MVSSVYFFGSPTTPINHPNILMKSCWDKGSKCITCDPGKPTTTATANTASEDVPANQENNNPDGDSTLPVATKNNKSTRKRKHDQDTTVSSVSMEVISKNLEHGADSVQTEISNSSQPPVEERDTTGSPSPTSGPFAPLQPEEIPAIVPSADTSQSLLAMEDPTRPDAPSASVQEMEDIIFLPPIVASRTEENKSIDLPKSLNRYMPYAPEFLAVVKNLGTIVDVYRGPPPNERRTKNCIVVDRAFYINCDVMKSKWLIWIYSKVYECITDDDISLLMERR